MLVQAEAHLPRCDTLPWAGRLLLCEPTPPKRCEGWKRCEARVCPAREIRMTDANTQPPGNGLRRALDAEVVQSLLEVAELRGEMRASLQAIARLKSIWPLVAAGIALVVFALRDWLFGQN
jgi:hypothetical protein